MRKIIEARGLCKRFGSFTAVDDISFEVRAGECFGLLGPNGAGKTSAIRMVYGFSPVTEGSLLVFGMDIGTQWREIRARIGVCQQENTLDPDLTVQENLHVFASYFRIPAKEARRRTDELLAFFALEKKSTAKVSELSGGLARRLTLARSLINNPELIILDEPTTGLDPQSRHLLWDRLQNLRARGTTLVLTTHYMEEAAYLCDRLMIMDHGTILVQGDPKGLIHEHAGESIIEVEQAGEDMMRFLGQESIPHEVVGERVLIYDGGGTPLEARIRNDYCVSRCTFRKATLEDVFLRLTGRELRE